MNTRARTLLLAMMLLPVTGMAADRSYSYFEGGYLSSNPDGLDSGDGFYARGSGAITENWHLFGGWGGTDHHGSDVTRWNIGLGYNVAIAPSWDLVGRLGYQRLELEFPGLDTSGNGDGYLLDVGVRGDLGPVVEGWAGVRHQDTDFPEPEICGLFSPPPLDCHIAHDQNGSDTSLYVGGQWKFAESWGLTAELSFGGQGNEVLVGPRLSF